MGDMTFADLQREVFGAHGIGDYRKALEAVEQEGGRFPDQEWRIYYWRACLTSRLNDVQAALQLLDEALAHGHWFPESTLRRDEDLRPLWGLPEFERVVEVCKARQQEAQQAAITKLITVEPEAEPPFPLLIALHGSLSNAESSVPFWRPAVERGWLLAVPQSSQVGPVGFLWGDRDWAAREIGEHHAALLESHGVDPERVVLGGFSRGAEVAAWLAMSGAIPARGLVAVGPPVGDLDDWQPLLGPAREAGVRGYLLVGEEDQFCLEGTKGLGAMLNYNGIPCEVDLRPGLGHDFPPDFDRTLARALDYILGDAS